jgi:hypothetical protein
MPRRGNARCAIELIAGLVSFTVRESRAQTINVVNATDKVHQDDSVLPNPTTSATIFDALVPQFDTQEG